MSKKGLNFALGTVIAAAVGYVAGILTAPRSGKQSRKKIAQSANKAKTDGEKQLKKLHSEIRDGIDKVEKQIAKTKGKAGDELKDAVKTGKEAQKKAKLILSALHDGDADDPSLNAAIADAKKARDNLKKFIKTPR